MPGGSLTNGISVWWWAGGSNYIVTEAENVLTTGNWYHIAITYDGSLAASSRFKIYVNGGDVTGASSTGGTISDLSVVDMQIGANGAYGEYFDGRIDDVRMYDSVLSAAEIASIAGVSPLEAGLVGHWTLDETSGTTAADSSGNGNDGTMGGGLSATNDSITGRVDGALDFDGADDYIDAGSGTGLDIPGDISISVWINADTISCPGWCDIVSNYNTAGNSAQYELAILNSQMTFNAGDGGSFTIYATTTSPPAGRWTHVVATRDTSVTNTRIYFDGVLQPGAFDAGPNTIPTSGFGNTTIGRAGQFNGQYFNGTIDDVRVYNRTLSSSEVSLLYCTSTPGKVEYNAEDNVMQFCSDTEIHAMGPVSDCSAIGDVCKDGSIFAGDTNLYVTDANQSAAAAWKTSTGTNDINPDSSTDGAANHANRAGLLSDFPAFELCENLTRHGHSDWYLPALNELNTLYLNQAAINASASENFVTASAYWSSTENSTTQAKREIFSDGTQGNTTKTSTRNIRCVRRGATPSAEKPVPVAWWKLDEISGTSTADSSGNGYTGTMQSGLDAGNNAVEGKFGNALTFDGVDDYIGIGQTYISTLSVSLWFYYDETPASEYTLFHRGYANSCRYMPLIGIDSGDMLGTNGTGGCGGGISGIPVSKGVWNHVVLTVTNGSQVLYLNGSAVGSDTDGFWGESLYTVIGGFAQLDDGIATGNYFKGKIDDVRIYDKALSLSEVQAIYNNADCSTPDGVEGQMYYNTSYDVMQYCNGTTWISIGK